jgi:hypothetical protein
MVHISPNDDPIVGQPASLLFEFWDERDEFRGQDCECVVNIIRNDETLFIGQLFAEGTGSRFISESLKFTFPEKAIYTIGVTGQPKVGSVFRPFRFSYDIRVDRTDSSVSLSGWFRQHQHAAHYIIFGAGLVAVASLYFRERKKLKSATKK